MSSCINSEKVFEEKKVSKEEEGWLNTYIVSTSMEIKTWNTTIQLPDITKLNITFDTPSFLIIQYAKNEAIFSAPLSSIEYFIEQEVEKLIESNRLK